MAKLYLKFESNVLKEVPVGQKGQVTIGRLPDNMLQIDNLAVSGHHCKVYWDSDHYVLEDNSSLNGTYVNNQRVSKQVLKDNDSILVGKHVVIFRDEWHEEESAPKAKAAMPSLPRMEATVVLDTKKAKEMLAQARAQQAATSAPAETPSPAPAPDASPEPAPPPKPAPAAPSPGTPTGALTVLEGKTEETHYLLSSKLTVIGGSKMATIKLKGSLFKSPPDVAAMISKGETSYFIAPQDRKTPVKVNGVEVSHRQELNEGDVIEVAGVKMSFAMQG
ncbi:MAG TPA: FHA domain-containing protein [Terriglobales bacterium]|jgi:predicted component of type VI protein secretion system|nr:FHA domain-containing protein [Terriglobales bacterium]